MELNFYTLSVLYLVYSFLGWVGETAVATAKGKHFANRGAAAGPFCFVYGIAAVLMAVGLADLRTKPAALFFGSLLIATVVEWLTGKLLERVHHRRWWDYSGKKCNIDGYICLQYSVLWGVLGAVSVRWGNGLLLRLCALVPPLLLHIAVWVSMSIAVLDQIGSGIVVGQYAARHPHLEQLNAELNKSSDRLRQKITASVEKRIQKAYPAAARREPTTAAETSLRFADLLWLFVIGAFLGDVVETLFCRVTAGIWMSRSSLVWGPFSVVFWDYSGFKFNLGGRINLLYCFFWGIAAVVWLRHGYPLIAKLMAKVRSHVRPWMTILLAVFMAVNMTVSALALARYDARTSGTAPANRFEVYLDAHFDDARMEQVYPNAKKVVKAN